MTYAVLRPRCLFCESTDFAPTDFPRTRFNKKLFRYLKCNRCGLVYVHPLPTEEDLLAMYPESYQQGVDRTLLADASRVLPGLRFSYKRHFDLISSYAPGRRVLDMGCGTGNFVANAIHAGLECDGAEFNPAHIVVLRKCIPETHFYAADELDGLAGRYDVVRLSNVLEHLTAPHTAVAGLLKLLRPGGLLLVEGPLEANATLAHAALWLYFKGKRFIGPETIVEQAPHHVFFSNSINQRRFFSVHGLEELEFESTERAWPFPERWSDVRNTGSLIKYLLSRASIGLSRLITGSGNTFLYVGKVAEAQE